MGYTTDFEGMIEVVPPLNEAEMDFLRKFAETRRMKRGKGPYYVDGSGSFGQGSDEDIMEYNVPPEGQPGLWCQWVPTHDGTGIEWDGNEKFYDSPEWMTYIIDHFLKPGCVAAKELPFLQANHVCNGHIYAQGEESSDMWLLEVNDNKVKVRQGTVTYG